MSSLYPDLTALNLFRLTAREGTVTAAAQALGMGQPQASRALAALQRRLGLVLLVRSGRLLVPTDAGLLFLEQADRALAEVEGLWESARTISAGRRAPIRMLVQSHLAHGLMPQVMADMRHAFPSLRIDLDIRQRNRLTQWANRAACDCVFATLPHDASWSVQTPLFDAEYLIGMPRNHPLKDVRRVKVEDLIGHAFVNVRAGLTTRDKLQEMCAMHNTVPSISLETGSVQSALQMAGAGLGLALCDPFTADNHAGNADLTFCRIVDGPTLNYGLSVKDPGEGWARKIAEILIRRAGAILARYLGDGR